MREWSGVNFIDFKMTNRAIWFENSETKKLIGLPLHTVTNNNRFTGNPSKILKRRLHFHIK